MTKGWTLKYTLAYRLGVSLNRQEKLRDDKRYIHFQYNVRGQVCKQCESHFRCLARVKVVTSK